MRRKWLGLSLGILVALIAIYVVLSLLAQPAGEHPFFAQFEQRPLVIAHQGGNGLWPDNTLFAFERAAAMGVDVLEMDLHSTADGALVVMHDDTVDRTTNGSGAIQSLTLEEIKALDAGYRWSADEGQTFPFRGQGITVPTLEEVFAAFPDVALNIEIKQAEPSLVEPFCQLIREYGMSNRVLVASFHQESIKAFRQACPEVATSTGEGEVIALFALSKLLLEATYGPEAQAVQVPEYRSGLHVLTPRFVDAAHGRGLEVHAWTINETPDMQRLVELGVDGIITDYPDRLMEVLDRAVPR
jgi:glycerophosphoryl diester phosphodiesterase